MAQLPEQSVHPARVCADFDHHVSLRSREKTSHAGSGQLHRTGTIARPICPQNEDLRLLVAQIASDRLDGTFRHGRSLLGLRVRTNQYIPGRRGAASSSHLSPSSKYFPMGATTLSFAASTWRRMVTLRPPDSSRVATALSMEPPLTAASITAARFSGCF